MAFATELSSFKDEDDFVQRFIVPLVARLGMAVVINHHGKREAGMDLIVGEIDRFGHIRYHGIQAKYEASIGKGNSHGLVADAKEAFAIGFTDPQKGGDQRISSFYGVNAGSISDEARDYFFAALLPQFGANVRLLEGRDLVALTRSSSIRTEARREKLDALLLETIHILELIARMVPNLNSIVAGTGHGVVYPMERLRLVATEAWLAQPINVDHLPSAEVEALHTFAAAFNRSLDEAGGSPLHTVVSIKGPAQKALFFESKVRAAALAVRDGVTKVIAELGILGDV